MVVCHDTLSLGASDALTLLDSIHATYYSRLVVHGSFLACGSIVFDALYALAGAGPILLSRPSAPGWSSGGRLWSTLLANLGPMVVRLALRR